MSLYQIIFSTLRMLAIATGLFALGRTILLGSGGGAWALMGLMSFLAIGASIIINRLPLHEKYVRFKDAPRWQELSPQRRFALFLFDLPLFFSIRDKEADRLRDEPLSRVAFEANCVTLQPVEARHLTWHFLTTIAWDTEHYGLKVSNANFGKFGLIFPGSKRVQLRGADERIVQYLRAELADGECVSLRLFVAKLRWAYASTLPEKERDQFFRYDR